MVIKKYIKLFTIIFIIILFLQIAKADTNIYDQQRIDFKINRLSTLFVLIGSLIILTITLFSLAYKKQTENHKKILYITILIATSLVSIFLIGSTLYVNAISKTKGPVHWHADFEIWKCNNKIDLIDPEGLSNRIGTPVFHEHNDARMHVEGVILDLMHVDLQSFFEVIGGSLDERHFSIPTNNGFIFAKNSDECDNESSILQVFLLKVVNPESDKKSGYLYKQEKLENFPGYVLSPSTSVPPGDCIIIEFAPEKPRTDHICETYKIALQKGELTEI